MKLLPAVVVAVSLGSLRLAAADCMMVELRVDSFQRDVVLLGTYEDLLGHHASYYVDARSGVIVGPVDHEGWPEKPAALRKLPTSLPIGTAGTLTVRARVQKAQKETTSGWFESFRPRGPKAEMPATIARISDPFALGLLAPAFPAAEAKVDVLRQDPARRDELGLAAQGMLYAAKGARAQTLLGGIALRDLTGARLDRLATFRDGGLPALAALAPEKSKSDWTDFLPELAAAWASKREPITVIDDLLLGGFTPRFPADVDPDFGMMRHHCGPSREEMRGPFGGPHEIDAGTVRDLLRAKEPLFAAKVEAGFTGAFAAFDQFVVGVRGKLVLVTGGGTDSVMALTVTRPVGIGAKLRFVSRSRNGTNGATGVVFTPPHLNFNSSAITFVGVATKLDIAAQRDVPGMIAALKAHATSGHLPINAGTALALLFEQADAVPGWTLADARAFAWTLPGNSYQTPQQWQQAWSEILAAAIMMATDDKLAGEIEAALPTIVAKFAQGPAGKTTVVPAELVRRFAIDLAPHVVARRLLANDLAGAARFVNLANGPLKAIAGTTRLTPEGARDGNYQTRIKVLEVLVAALGGAKVRPPSDGDRTFGMDLFAMMMRPYVTPETWTKALVSAGYSPRR